MDLYLFYIIKKNNFKAKIVIFDITFNNYNYDFILNINIIISCKTKNYYKTINLFFSSFYKLNK